MAYVLLVLASLIAGSTPAILKLGLAFLPPFALMLFRFLIATPLFYVIFRKQITFKYPIAQLSTLFLISSFTPISLALIIKGLEKTQVLNVQSILSFIPVIVAAGAVYFLKEQIKNYQLVGMALSFIGVLVTIARPLIELSQQSTVNLVGNMYVFLAALAASAYILFSKRISTHFSIYTILCAMFIDSVIIFVSLTLLTSVSVSAILTTKVIGLVVYLGISTCIFFLLHQYLIETKGAFFAALTPYLQVPISALCASYFFSEQLTVAYVIGTIIILFGSVIATDLIAKVKINSYS